MYKREEGNGSKNISIMSLIMKQERCSLSVVSHVISGVKYVHAKSNITLQLSQLYEVDAVCVLVEPSRGLDRFCLC